MISDLYFVNLKDIAPLRSRSCKQNVDHLVLDEDGQVVVLKWKS